MGQVPRCGTSRRERIAVPQPPAAETAGQRCGAAMRGRSASHLSISYLLLLAGVAWLRPSGGGVEDTASSVSVRLGSPRRRCIAIPQQRGWLFHLALISPLGPFRGRRLDSSHGGPALRSGETAARNSTKATPQLSCHIPAQRPASARGTKRYRVPEPSVLCPLPCGFSSRASRSSISLWPCDFLVRSGCRKT